MVNLIIGIAIGMVLCLIVYFIKPKRDTNGLLEIYDSNDEDINSKYHLILFDPIEDWGKREYLRIRVKHREDKEQNFR